MDGGDDGVRQGPPADYVLRPGVRPDLARDSARVGIAAPGASGSLWAGPCGDRRGLPRGGQARSKGPGEPIVTVARGGALVRGSPRPARGPRAYVENVTRLHHRCLLARA